MNRGGSEKLTNDDVLRYWVLFDTASKDRGGEHILNFAYGGSGRTVAIENVVVGCNIRKKRIEHVDRNT
jgi:hypothetical protein